VPRAAERMFDESYCVWRSAFRRSASTGLMSWPRCLLCSVRIEVVTHTSVLQTRRRGAVRRSQYQNRGQLVLEL
jgi:hypothetical protein